MHRPSILYLHSHDTGRYVQPYGHPVPTPRLQAFAEQSVLFRQAFSAAPTCSPSRAALVTGQYPHCCGMHGLASTNFGYKLKDYRYHLAWTLRDAGYRTALSGVQHVARLPWADPHQMGYDRLLNYDDTDRTVSDSLSAATAFLEEPQPGPFFLSVGFFETHRDQAKGGMPYTHEPCPDPADVDSRYTQPPPGVADTPETRLDFANFKVGARILDDKVGAILDTLARTGLDRTTLVIITTDHGIAWPGCKATLSDQGLGVMLMMRGPTDMALPFEPGHVIDPMVSHLDLYPTLCELIGIDAPAWLQGKSLLPLLTGPTQKLHDVLFGEQGHHGTKEPLRSVRTDRYKLIRRFGPSVFPSNTDEGPVRDLFARHGWPGRDVEPLQLYDLLFDPLEQRNLIDSPVHQPIREELDRYLTQWMCKTEDPLLNGDIPQPPAYLARRDADKRHMANPQA